MPSDIHLATDAELLMRFISSQDEEAFAELVRKHAELVHGIARRVLRHDQDVEDAFQATFLILARRPRAIRKASSISSWLYQVAYRTSMRAAKRRQKMAAVEIQEDPAVQDDALSQIQERELADILHRELACIPERYRGPLVLCHLEQKSRMQAAEELELSEASVKARLARGRKMLRIRLAQRGVGLSIVLALIGKRTTDAGEVSRLADLTISQIQTDGVARIEQQDITSEVTQLTQEGIFAMTVPTLAKSVAAIGLIGAMSIGLALYADEKPTIESDTLSLGTNSVDPSVASFSLAQRSNQGNTSRDGESDFSAISDPASETAIQDPALDYDFNPNQGVSRRPSPVNPPSESKMLREARAQYFVERARAFQMLARAMNTRANAAQNRGTQRYDKAIGMADRDEALGREALFKAESNFMERQAEIILSELKSDSEFDTKAKQSSTNAGPVLRPGVQLRIRVDGTTPDSGLHDAYYTVEPQGTVPLGPRWGRVKLEGLTLEEAESHLKKRLSEFFSEPSVQITFGRDAAPKIH